MHALKLTQIGNALGVILPKEMLAKLKLEKGQSVFVTETHGGYVLTPYDPALEEQRVAALMRQAPLEFARVVYGLNDRAKIRVNGGK